MTDSTVRILIAEDNSSDVELVERELRRAGMNVSMTVVQTRHDFLAALRSSLPELIMSDYRMPAFDGMDALTLARQHAPDVPFIFVTGSMDEETAVECIKAGAVDYVVKEHIGKIAVAVPAALARRRERADRRKAEGLLRDSEERFRRTVEEAPLPIIIHAENGEVISINKAWTEITGYTHEDMPTIAAWIDKAYQSRKEDVRAVISKLYGIQRRVAEGEFTITTKSGELRVWEFSSAPLGMLHDGTRAVISMAMDVTERKQAEEKLRQAYDELKSAQAQLLQSAKMASVGVLAAGVAHEINNPSAFILTNLNVLRKYAETIGEFCRALSLKVAAADSRRTVDELKDDLEITAVLEDMPSLIAQTYDGAERIKKIVQDLRLFARPDTGTVESVDINGCIETTLNIIRSEIRYKAELRKEYGDIPMVACNPHQMSQVFMNVLVNASQSIETYGTVTIRTYADAGSVVVEIRDTGSGIPEDKLARIFDPFYTTKEVGKGTGLGLSIVKGIVEKHQGAVEVKSEVGKGTTFVIKLPVGK